LNAPGQEAMVVDSLTLEQYHQICYWYLSNWRNISISPDVTVNLGTVITCSSGDQLQDFVEIVFFPDVDVRFSHWDGAQGEVMEDGWTRYFIRFTWKAIFSDHVYSSFNSSDVFNCTLSANMWYYAHGRSWLSQANHIFSRLGITSDFENYRMF
jgi:hypothetical protein